MNIEKAISHFRWKFQNKWKPTEPDIEAYNAIIKFKETQEKINLDNNELFAKMWVHQLILLNESKAYTAERSIQVIDDILSLSMDEWCFKLHSKLSQMRLNSFLEEKYSLDLDRVFQNEKIAEEYKEEIMNILKTDIKEEDVIRFVEKQITRIINI